MNHKRSELGLFYGILAYGLWGLIPIYFKAVKAVPPVDLLAHRVIWSFLVLAVVVAFLKRWPELIRELRDRKLRVLLALSTICIAVNWLVFIYAISSGQILQSSLGYFITPLVSVFLGIVVLRERLRRLQLASVAIAVGGMLLFAWHAGQLPWISLTLAFSFGTFGLLRKLLPVDGLIGLTVETFFMLPVAIPFLAWRQASGSATPLTPNLMFLLLLSGPITTAPLLLFGGATRRLRLSTMGILQYLAPTLSFLLAVFAYGEPFSTVQLISFIIIWTAIIIYTADSLWAVKNSRHLTSAGSELA